MLLPEILLELVTQDLPAALHDQGGRVLLGSSGLASGLPLPIPCQGFGQGAMLGAWFDNPWQGRSLLLGGGIFFSSFGAEALAEHSRPRLALDKNRRLVWANPAARALLGIPQDAETLWPLSRVLGRSSLKEFWPWAKAALADGKTPPPPLELDLELAGRPGGPTLCRLEAGPCPGNSTEDLLVLIDPKGQESPPAPLPELLGLFFEQAPVAAMLFDQDLRLNLANGAARSDWAPRGDRDIEGLPIAEAFPGAKAEMVREAARAALEKGRAVFRPGTAQGLEVCLLRLERPPGAPWLGAVATPTSPEMDQLLQAQRNSREKSLFLANMSHEIRTPLTSILGFLELLEAENRQPELRKKIAAIRQGGNTLLNLVNNILDFSKIEAGKQQLHPEATSLRMLGREMLNLFEEPARAKGIDFELRVDDSVPELLLLDELRIKQVLINLVSNAVKFTEKGRVLLDIRARTNPNGTANLLASVRDTGIGISQQAREKVFSPFFQEHQEWLKYGGTGLGLAISRKLVEMMGGELGLESAPGKGSRFTINIRQVEVLEQQRQDAGLGEPVHFGEGTVVLADDIESNRKVMRKFMEDAGLLVIEAENGETALFLIEHFRPDVAVVDLRMPLMDGFRLAETIQARRIPVKLVAVSASTEKDIQRQALASGFLAFVRKPLSSEQLLAKLAEVLPARPRPPARANGAADGAARPTAPSPARAPLPGADWVEPLRKARESSNFDEIASFASRLGQAADTLCNPAIGRLCQALADACDSFDVEAMRLALDRIQDALPKNEGE